ncbi:MAG: PASTA domain-containing protein, partial [Clostridia bacterium]|nr:PASTA domain-containing protein [Clostridia bacterium]
SGDTVVLFVSRGPEEGDIAVPDLIGKTEAEALILLSKMRLSVGNVIYERSDKDSGTILSQSILPDTMVTAHTPIDLNVSGGPRYGRGAADDDSGDSDSDGSEPDSGTPITLSPIDEITVTSETKNKDPDKTSSSSGSDEPSSGIESESESETETEDTESESDGGEATPERDDG